jgi:hypothetical protein
LQIHRIPAPLFLSLTILAGCGGATSPIASPIPAPALTPGGATTIVVIQQASPAHQILSFSASGNGSVSPTHTLTLPVGVIANTVVVDASGQTYVGVFGIPNEVLVYAAGATGAATPVRTITATLASFDSAMIIAVDFSGFLYVYSQSVQGRNPSISVFSPAANGAALPTRLITGSATLLDYGFGLTIDKSGNLYAVDTGGSGAGEVLAFSPTATGNVAPSRVITGSLGQTYGIDTDSAGNLYVLTYTSGPSTLPAVLEFAPTATGNSTPVRSISGNSTGLTFATGLRVDAAGNIYVCAQGGTGPTYSNAYVAAFNSTQTGNVVPIETITSTSWNKPGLRALAVE